MNSRLRRQDGSVAVETAILAPVLLVLMLLVVYAGRAAQTDADVQFAAARAARAASLTGDDTAAEAAAISVATRNLATAGVTCRQVDIGVTAEMRPGGMVTVQVACEVSNADLALLAVPGSRWSSASGTQVVDRHRGAADG